MAVIYGFFFILLSAIARMSETIYDLSVDMSIPSYYRLIALEMFYMLVLFAGLAMGIFGLGLYWSMTRLLVPKVLRNSLLVVVLMLPLFFSIAIGFMLRMSLFLIACESIVISLGPIFIYSLRRKTGFF